MSDAPPACVLRDVPLAPLTTLQVGGPARFFASVSHGASLHEILRWAAAAHVPTLIMGGGSNLLVADAGYNGLVVQYTAADWSLEERGKTLWLRAEAGMSWDALVAASAERGLAGLECLSGIPGWVGAVPIQNVGAYGQEIADSLVDVEAVHRPTGTLHRLAAAACGFAYRDSHFKGPWRDAYVVTAVRFKLRPGLAAAPRYPELQVQIPGEATPAALRDAVLALRRRKSMVWDPSDPNHRSAGSFFTNPIVPANQAATLREKWGEALPVYPAPTGFAKLSAAWLIEHAGLTRGFVHGDGAVGLSSHHTLAIINRGHAKATDIVALAAHIRRTVAQRFGVRLVPEAQGVGFATSLDALLDE